MKTLSPMDKSRFELRRRQLPPGCVIVGPGVFGWSTNESLTKAEERKAKALSNQLMDRPE